VCIYGYESVSQNLKNFVCSNANKIDTFDDYDSLLNNFKCFDSIFNKVRIVFIGEQSHGDASTFKAKAQLIKYLNQKHGFNSLAFESDFYSLDYLNKIAKSISTDSINFILRNSIHNEWTSCNILDSFFYNYISDKIRGDSLFKLVGFDPQYHGVLSTNYFCLDLNSYLHKLKIKNYNADRIDSFTNKIKSTFFTRNNLIEYKCKLKDLITSIIDIQCSIQYSNIVIDSFWLVCINNLKSDVITNLNYYKQKFNKIDRDRQMAENLKYLIKSNNNKFIVWAANAHIAKSLSESNKSYKSMGEYLKKDTFINNNSYSIAFTSLFGKTKSQNQNIIYDVNNFKKNSFETWIPFSHKHSFIDFVEFRKTYTNALNKKFVMRCFGHSNKKAKWLKNFDGVFFIREMKPCN
jgi:erythromycin esterase-like protein